MPITDIANFLHSTRAPTRAEIDREHALVDRERLLNDQLRNQLARQPQLNRRQDLEIQAAEQGLEHGRAAFSAEQRKTAGGVLAHNFAAIAQSPRPWVTAQQFLALPDFKKAAEVYGWGPQFVAQFSVTDQDTDDSIRGEAMNWARRLGTDIGVPLETLVGPGDSLLQRNPVTNELTSIVGRAPREPQPQASEPLETVLDEQTGQPTLVPRSRAAGRQPWQKPTGGLSARDATTARTKLNQIAIARQQLALTQQRFNAIRKSMSAGPGWTGQGLLPTESGKQFDAAVDSMRNVLSAITRVPGIGAMSDFETRLAQAQFPTRRSHESVTQQQIDSIASLLAQLEQGYAGILGDSGAELPTGSAQPFIAPATGAQPITATGPGGQKVMLVNGQWVPMNAGQ